MKKKQITLIALILLTLSCSKDDSGSGTPPPVSQQSSYAGGSTPLTTSGGHLTPAFGRYEALEESEQLAGHGKFQFLLHDTQIQGTVDSILMDIQEIRIVSESGGVLPLPNSAIKFDLLKFTVENPLQIVNTKVPTGRYCQIRLMFAENQTIKINGTDMPLKTPSAETWQSGFKLDSTECFDIIEGQLFSMTVDFDPNESIVYNPGPPGQDRYILKPVVKIVGTSSVIINQYNMDTHYGGETLVVQFDTGGKIKFISSEDPQNVYCGNYLYVPLTKMVTISFTEVYVIDPDCSECSKPVSVPADLYNLDPKYTSFEVVDYTDSMLKLTMTATGETLVFDSRRTFGPFEE
jgi:hypothetical protein